MDRSYGNSGSDTKVSGLCSRLRGHRNQRWVFTLSVRPTTAGSHRFVRHFPFLPGNQIGPFRRYPNCVQQAPMNRDLSPDEQREFWVQLFAVVVRHETRKRAELEVALELLEEVRQTEANQI